MFCPACNFDLRGLTAHVCPECGRAFDPANPSTFLARPRSWLSRNLARIVLGIAALVVLALIVGGYTVYRGIQITIEAEDRLQATRVIAEVIGDYVEKSPDHTWPKSWAELETIPNKGCMFRWPAESAKYQSIVKIDFTLTTADVLKQSPTSCTAVTVTPGPSFSGFPAMELQPLFTRLQELDERGLIPHPPAQKPAPMTPP